MVYLSAFRDSHMTKIIAVIASVISFF